jgi:hypothetical protein
MAVVVPDLIGFIISDGYYLMKIIVPAYLAKHDIALA